MGGRGSSSGIGSNGEIQTSNTIRTKFIQDGINSKFKGVARMAAEGTGNYSYKDSKAVSGSEALKMEQVKIVEKDGKTLAYGHIGQKDVFYAADSNNATIKQLKAKAEAQKGYTGRSDDIEIRTTSTYNRWKKQHDKNFKAWFNGGK